MRRYLRRGRYFAALIVAFCAMVAVCEVGALPHDLVETDAREARMWWLRAVGLGLMIVIVGLISLVRFSRPPPPRLPRAAVRS